NSALDEAQVGKIYIDFTSEEQSLRVSGGGINYKKSTGLFDLSLPVQSSEAAGLINLRLEQETAGSDPETPVKLIFEEFPLAKVVAHFGGAEAIPLPRSVSGEMTASLGPAGTVKSALFDLRGAPGTMGLTAMGLDGAGPAVEYFAANGSYAGDPSTLTLDNLSVKGPALTTDLTGTATLPRNTNAVRFDLRAGETVLSLPGFFAEPFGANEIKAAGTILGRQAIILDQIAVTTDDIGFDGSFSFQNPQTDGPPQSPGLKANLKTSGRIGKERLMALWPVSLAPRARGWVSRRIKEGYAENLFFTMDMAPGVKSSLGFIPNDSLFLSFDVLNVDAEIIPGMTPLTRARGNGRLYGNKLEIAVDRGAAGPVNFSKGAVTLPQFSPRGGGQIFSFAARGEATDMLRLINEKPLSLLQASGLKPTQISGDAAVDMTVIRRPDWQQDKPRFSYDGTAAFENLILLEAWQDLDLTDAVGTMDLSDGGLSIAGTARLGVTPVDIVWSQDFTASRDPSRLTLAGRFDASTADLLGIPTRSVLAGPVDLAIDARGRYRTFSRLDIAADFSDATLTLDDLAWRKQPGVLTALDLTIRYGADGRQSGEITIDGEGLDIQGTYSLFADGRLAGLAMPVVAIDRYADFSFEASRARGEALEALVSGSFINLGPVVERFLSNPDLGTNTGKGTVEDGQEGAANDWGRGMKARLRFDRLELRNGISLADASLDIVHDSQNLKVLNLSGFDADRRPLSVLLSSDPADATSSPDSEKSPPVQRTVVAETTNIGDLMRGIFGLTSLRGGAGQMTLALANRPGGPIGGTLAARGLQVVDAPMLAKLFAAGSLEALADLMSDQGIALQSVEALFEISDGKIDISEANAVGPSVGLSAAGTIGLDGTGVALAGALAPIYQINAILGNTPLIGPLLVNRKGEGLLAVSYEITGEVTAPMVTIKPLSALAPGVLRRAFENEDILTDPP
ncbi:MAG: AsmA-like C-terminal region-containing protein, partial [Pseudomonadota bacterium]